MDIFLMVVSAFGGGVLLASLFVGEPSSEEMIERLVRKRVDDFHKDKYREQIKEEIDRAAKAIIATEFK